MNIAHVVESLDVGGAEVVVSTLCRLQQEAGHHVIVHCLLRSGPLARQLEQLGISIYVHGQRSNWRLIQSLWRELRNSRREVVHCHNVASTIFGAPAARMAGARAVISTRHGSISPIGRRKVLFALAARFCNYIVGVGEAPRDVLVSELGVTDKIIVIRNCALPAPVIGFDAIQKQGFTALMVSRLTPPKDPATLLRAMALAFRQVNDLYLWFVGDGVLMTELRRLAEELEIREHVCFAGERADVGNWLAMADVFVLSSLSEGVPLSLLEAMAAGLPSIVTNVGGMTQIAEMSRAAILVEPGQPERMAKAIVDYATRRQDLPALGRLARQCYHEHFSPERWVNQYLSLYQRCLSGQPVDPVCR